MFVSFSESLGTHLSLVSRAFLSFLTSLMIALLVGKPFISYLKSKKLEQMIRDFGPQSHLSKAGTPTMGGVLIIISTMISCALWVHLNNQLIQLLLFTLLAYGAIGFFDDYKKVAGASYKGITAKHKYGLQSLIAVIVIIFVIKIFRHTSSHLLNDLYVPLLGFVHYPLYLMGFFVLSYFVIIGSSNAVNLTDGLDGLAISSVIFISLFLSVMLLMIHHSSLHVFDLLKPLISIDEVLVFMAALIGSSIAFLWFNAHPAEIFMGDVGSLSLGATLGLVAILLRQEIIFFIISLIFVTETLSVIIQLSSIKLRHKKVFLMTPIHHHFELKGWSETKIVSRFSLITLMLIVACSYLLSLF